MLGLRGRVNRLDALVRGREGSSKRQDVRLGQAKVLGIRSVGLIILCKVNDPYKHAEILVRE